MMKKLLTPIAAFYAYAIVYSFVAIDRVYEFCTGEKTKPAGIIKFLQGRRDPE